MRVPFADPVVTSEAPPFSVGVSQVNASCHDWPVHLSKVCHIGAILRHFLQVIKTISIQNRNLIKDDAFDDDGLNRSIDGLSAFPSLAMCSAMSSYFSYGKTPEI